MPGDALSRFDDFGMCAGAHFRHVAESIAAGLCKDAARLFEGAAVEDSVRHHREMGEPAHGLDINSRHA